MTKFVFSQIDDPESLMRFWSTSPDATIFTHPVVLPKLVNQIEWWMAYNRDEPVCLWPICKSGFRNGGHSRFAYYVGPLWGNEYKTLSAHRWFQVSGQVYSGFIDQFRANRFPSEVSMAPTLPDIRHFIWLSTLTSEQPSVQVTPRYTAVLDLDTIDPENISKSVSTNRSREVRKIQNSDRFAMADEINTGQIVQLYESFFAKENILMRKTDHSNVQQLCDLIKSGYGFYSGYLDTASGRLISIAIILFDHLTANIVLNLTHNEYRSTGVGTATILHAIITSKQHGRKLVDFNGANHPQRAFYKHSFGAMPQLYFDLNFIWS
jgi:hypothetical protein